MTSSTGNGGEEEQARKTRGKRRWLFKINCPRDEQYGTHIRITTHAVDSSKASWAGKAEKAARFDRDNLESLIFLDGGASGTHTAKAAEMDAVTRMWVLEVLWGTWRPSDDLQHCHPFHAFLSLHCGCQTQAP